MGQTPVTSSAINPDELILVSVDDHICEPADMFERHVPARWLDQAPHVVDEPDGSQQWYYGSVRGRNHTSESNGDRSARAWSRRGRRASGQR